MVGIEVNSVISSPHPQIDCDDGEESARQLSDIRAGEENCKLRCLLWREEFC